MRIVFMGTPDFAVPSLQSLINEGYEIVGIVTQPDRPKGRKQELTPSPVKLVAIENEIEVFQPNKIRAEEAIEKVVSWNPDLIVTAAYGQIIPDAILKAPKYKAINVHASLLPKFRGAAPIHQSIIQGEKETGVTIMYMVKELDAGDMLSSVKIPIEIEDNVGSLHEKLSIAGAKLLIDTIKQIEAGNVTPIVQNPEEATFAPTLKREDERIDWNVTSMRIYNKIRGLNPWPVAYTHFRNEVFKIWWAEPVEYQHNELPGTILKTDKNLCLVATKDGGINLIEVQPAGKRKMNIQSFLQGANVEVGEKLGE